MIVLKTARSYLHWSLDKTPECDGRTDTARAQSALRAKWAHCIKSNFCGNQNPVLLRTYVRPYGVVSILQAAYVTEDLAKSEPGTAYTQQPTAQP